MRRAPEAAPVPSLLPSHIDHCLLNTHHIRRHIPSIFPPRLQALPHTAPLPKHHHHLLPTPPTPLSQPPSHITSHITSHSVSSKRKNCFQAARPPGPTPGAPVRRGAHWYPASHLSIQKKNQNPTTPKKPTHAPSQCLDARPAPESAGNVPPNTANVSGPASAPDTATRREKKGQRPSPPTTTPPMLVQYPYKKLRQKNLTHAARPLVCPGKEEKKNKSKKIDGTPAIDKSIPRANQTETKPGRATGPKLSHNNKKMFIVSRPSIHPSMQPGKEKHPPLTAHPAQNLPSIPHSTTWPRSCSSAASAASGHTTPPS